MEHFYPAVFGILVIAMIWYTIRTIARAIDRINSMERNHDEITGLLNEIKEELRELNSKR